MKVKLGRLVGHACSDLIIDNPRASRIVLRSYSPLRRKRPFPLTFPHSPPYHSCSIVLWTESSVAWRTPLITKSPLTR